MNKEVLGLLLLVLAVINIKWGIDITRLLQKKGTPEEVDRYKSRAKRLSNISKISLIIAFAIGWFFLYK